MTQFYTEIIFYGGFSIIFFCLIKNLLDTKKQITDVDIKNEKEAKWLEKMGPTFINIMGLLVSTLFIVSALFLLGIKLC